MIKRICKTCAKEYNTWPSQKLFFCNKDCYLKTGDKNPKWRGGVLHAADGYIYIYKPEHQHATKMGYVLEHRLVMESHIGRLLKKKEVVHHINKNRRDNRIENLMLFSSSGEHTLKEHIKGRDKLGRFLF